MRRSTILMIAAGLVAGAATAFAGADCGSGIGDWCPPPPGDPCGRHTNVAECKADPACYGMPYRGVSFLPCVLDERGFGVNCPTVGCTAAPPKAGPH